MGSSLSSWPKAGDVAFKASAQWHKNASVGDTKDISLAMIIEGYFEAAELLIDQSKEYGRHNSNFIYPILFLYRHYIELKMKYFLTKYSHEKMKIGHKLIPLWKQIQDTILSNLDDDDLEATIAVESIVMEFNTIDPKSDSFRYATHSNGVEIKFPFEYIDLDNLKEVMRRIYNFFVGCDGELEEHFALKSLYIKDFGEL